MAEIGMMERPWMAGTWTEPYFEMMEIANIDEPVKEVERNEGARLEAFNDVETAMTTLKEARHWIEPAANESIDKPLQYRIASYYDQITDLLGWLEEDKKKWERE